MSREILFKAKMIDDGKWMEGVPVDVTPLTCFSFDAVKKEVLMVRAGFADWGMPRGLEGAKVDPSTVCQYTGKAILQNQVTVEKATEPVEPFPEKRTRKYRKKQNESLIFCGMLVHAA